MYFFYKQPYNEQDNVQSDGHYHKINPYGIIQIRSPYKGLFGNNDQLNVPYPLLTVHFASVLNTLFSLFFI